MKILITGAGGQLSTEIIGILNSGKTERGDIPEMFLDSEISALDEHELDITNKALVNTTIAKIKPDVILNCSAYTAVDKAEENVELCYGVNALGAEYLAFAAKETGAKYLLPSSESVFGGGVRTPYKETDETVPTNVYGATKLKGEQLALAAYPKTLIIRAGWLYGYYGKNFVKTMISLGKQKESIKVVNDQFGNPTNVNNFCFYMFKLLEKGACGVYHCAEGPVTTRYEFASAIMRFASLPCKVNPCTTSEYPLPAPRSDYMGLDTSKIESETGIKSEEWSVTLKRFIKNYLAKENA